MKKVVSILLFLIIIGGGVAFGVTAANNLKGDTAQKQVLPASSQNKGETQESPTKEVKKPGIPQNVRIPTINVDAEVESVGLDAKKRMDVPKIAENAGWYNLGARPGDIGNAVLAGHLDKADGTPAVFWEASKLKAGDEIFITDDKGKEYTFSVVRVETYPFDKFPLDEVFGQTSNAMLNLISCKGEWDEVTKNYSHRTVVYSQLVE